MEVPEVPDRFQLERHFSSDRTASIVYLRFVIPRSQTRPFLKHLVEVQQVASIDGEEVHPTTGTYVVDEGIQAVTIPAIDGHLRHARRKYKIIVATKGIRRRVSGVCEMSTAKIVYEGDGDWNPRGYAIEGRHQYLEEIKAKKQPARKAPACKCPTAEDLELVSTIESASEFHTYIKALYDLRGSLPTDADKIVLHALQSIDSDYLRDQTSLINAMPEDTMMSIFEFLTVQESRKIARASKCVRKIMKRMLRKRGDSLTSDQNKVRFEALTRDECETGVHFPQNDGQFRPYYFDVYGVHNIEDLDLQAPTLKYWIETSAKFPSVARVHFDMENTVHNVNVKVRGENLKYGCFTLASANRAEEA